MYTKEQAQEYKEVYDKWIMAPQFGFDDYIDEHTEKERSRITVGEYLGMKRKRKGAIEAKDYNRLVMIGSESGTSIMVDGVMRQTISKDENWKVECWVIGWPSMTRKMREPELKPCPFCGIPPLRTTRYGMIICETIGCPLEDMMIQQKDWNKREES